MRRDIATIGATLAAAALGLASAGTTASAAAPQTAQADAALRYLYTQVGADGSVAASMGATEDTVISVADNGYDPATLRNPASGATAYAYLSAHASAIATAGAAAKYVLTWLAAGRPAAIDATRQLTRLNTPVSAGGFLEPKGTFHSRNPAVETANAYSQSLAILADVAASVTLPPRASQWLVCAQRSDGGFGFAINDVAATPPSSCGDSSSDSNDTGIVLQALGRAGVTPADPAAMTYLRGVQQPDGGFGFNAGGPSSDPDSDAVVIQAIVAIGQDPTGAAWSVLGGTAVADMESFATQGGGYSFARGAASDAFTTSPVPQALALAPYGAATSVVAGTSPPPTPAPPTPSSSSSPVGPSSQGVPVPTTGSGALVPGLLVAAGLGLAGAAARRRHLSLP